MRSLESPRQTENKANDLTARMNWKGRWVRIQKAFNIKLFIE
jgi:hypothetical protein